MREFLRILIDDWKESSGIGRVWRSIWAFFTAIGPLAAIFSVIVWFALVAAPQFTPAIESDTFVDVRVEYPEVRGGEIQTMITSFCRNSDGPATYVANLVGVNTSAREFISEVKSVGIPPACVEDARFNYRMPDYLTENAYNDVYYIRVNARFEVSPLAEQLFEWRSVPFVLLPPED